MRAKLISLAGIISGLLSSPVLSSDSNPSSIVASYPLDGRAIDVSGNELHGLQAGVTVVTNRFGESNRAMAFDGVTSYIDCGSPRQFGFTNGFTVAAWVLLNGEQPEKYIVAKYAADYSSNTRSPRSWGLGVSNDGRRLYSFMSYDSPAYVDATASKNLVDGKWHHAAMVYQPGFGMRLYVDGIQEAVRNFSSFPSPVTNAVPLTIGRAASGQAFAGQIDDILIFNRALSGSEVSSLTLSPMNLEIRASRATKLDLATRPGSRYQLQYSDSLAGWQAIGDPFLADGTNTVFYVEGFRGAEFFRYLQIP